MKWKLWSIFVLGLVCFSFYCGAVTRYSKETMQKTHSKIIVLDSGHGGVDPGKVGITGSIEKDINLSITKKLRDLLTKQGFQVVMTREQDEGLYQESDRNKKKADLMKRVEIINSSKAALAISIHQNSFPSESVKGAQVFYYAKTEQGGRLGERMQEALCQSLDQGNHRKAKANSSYYMLKNCKVPFIIVECGFLSNYEEEKLLSSDDYQIKMAEAIALGVSNILKE